MVPIEREAKERSSVLLFVICGDTLSVASMVEVSYYLGQGRPMVLCISDIPQPSSQETVDIEGMKVRQWPPARSCGFAKIHGRLTSCTGHKLAYSKERTA